MASHHTPTTMSVPHASPSRAPFRLGALLALALVLAACDSQSPPGPDASPTASGPVLADATVGVSLDAPVGWALTQDPVLYDDGYGVTVWGEDTDPLAEGAHDREPIARVALVHDASPDHVEALAQAQMDEYAELGPARTEVTVGDGLRGVAVTGLPGTQPYSVVYVASQGRVYEVGLWTDEPGLDDRARGVLSSLDFAAPTQPVEALGLQTEAASLNWEPTGEMATRNLAAQTVRRQEAQADVDAGFITLDGSTVDVEPESEGPQARRCGRLAPFGTQFQWQTQWDDSARYYGTAGWTRMSTGGSFWGQGFHKYCASPNYHNQYFANDWALQFGANVYSHFSGTVQYAGWATGGWRTLGRIVIVRRGKWSSLSAHLNGWGPGIYKGASVNAPWTVIGYAGNTDGGTGYNWIPHLHSRVTWGERYTAAGMPFGGESVQPRAFRCYACTRAQADEVTPDGRKWYTNFYKGRWMRR